MSKEFIKQSPLTAIGSSWSLVLHENELNLFKNGRYILNKFQLSNDYCPLYFGCVCHDKDLDDEERLEPKHYQCVITFVNSYAKKTLIKVICDLFHCNENQVGLDKVVDICKMSRYLLHRGWPSKHQYDVSELVCNDIDKFMEYYNMIEIKDQLDCVSIVEHYHYDLRDIIIHVSNYSKWRTFIKDLIQDNRYKMRY